MDERPRAIGFWSGPNTSAGWPEVDQFIDLTWDEEERDFVVGYLSRGVLGRTGHSTCRICGRADNGDSEYSDGMYVWPSGFGHYVSEHGVRPPAEFVEHALRATARLEGDRDESWWRALAR